MKKYVILLICFSFSLDAYEIFGPIWISHNVMFSPNLGIFVNAKVADCKYTWNNKIWYIYNYFCHFEFQYSNSSPYNMFWLYMDAETKAVTNIRP